jgi:hypothetical protein
MTQSTQLQREGVAQVAGRILMAWLHGENSGLQQELAQAEWLDLPDTLDMTSTLDMERLEALSGAVESLRQGRQQAGAVRLLEHLAKAGTRTASSTDLSRLDAGCREVSFFEVGLPH